MCTSYWPGYIIVRINIGAIVNVSSLFVVFVGVVLAFDWLRIGRVTSTN